MALVLMFRTMPLSDCRRSTCRQYVPIRLVYRYMLTTAVYRVAPDSAYLLDASPTVDGRWFGDREVPLSTDFEYLYDRGFDLLSYFLVKKNVS
jgi:hypothetical protein